VREGESSRVLEEKQLQKVGEGALDQNPNNRAGEGACDILDLMRLLLMRC